MGNEAKETADAEDGGADTRDAVVESGAAIESGAAVVSGTAVESGADGEQGEF